MGIIGSSWKDEETPEEQYKNITGQDYQGDNLRKDIEMELDSKYTSRNARRQLLDLLTEITKNNL